MFKKEKRRLSRFLELLNPTTNNFQFWLASSAFSFFAYTSVRRGVCINTQGLLAWVFMIFGYLCLAILLFLLISWLFGFRIETPAERKSGKAKRMKEGDRNKK